MLDRERLAQFLDGLDRLLADWRDILRESSTKRLREERAFSQRVCYVVLAATQIALDIANMLIAEKALPRPNSYRETFDILEKEGLVAKRPAATLKNLAGLRNRLVHRYIELDWAKVQGSLKNGLPALSSLRRSVSRRTRR